MSRGRPPSRPDGFSLLELIAALTILVAVIGLLGGLVSDTRRAWQQGTEQARAAGAARAAFALLDGDLGAAIARTNLLFVLREPRATEPSWMDAWDGALAFHRLATGPRQALDEGGRTRALRVVQQVHLTAVTNALGLAELRRDVRLIPADLDPQDPDNSFWATDWPDLDGFDPAESAPVLTHLAAIRWRVPYEFVPWPDEPDEEPVTELPWRELTHRADYRSDEQEHRLPPLLDLEVAILPDRLARRSAALTPSQRAEFIRLNAIWFAHRFHLRQREGVSLP